MNDQVLLDFIRIVKSLNIAYWLDSGALLGLCRSGTLIHWDNDLDFGVWEEGLESLIKHKKEIKKQGYSLTVRSYKKLIYGATLKNMKDPQCLPIHIHVFFRHDTFVWSPQTVIHKPEDSKYPFWVNENSSKMRRFLNFCKREAKYARDARNITPRVLAGYGFAYPIWGAFFVIRKRLDRNTWATKWPFKLYHRIYTWIIPSRFFDTLDEMRIGQEMIPIPSQVEEYLALRYHDWRTPVKDWHYWEDDGCLVPLAPEKALLQYTQDGTKRQ